MTQVCNECNYPINHPLGIHIDSTGTCRGCHIHREKSQLHWSSRLDVLFKTIAPYKSTTTYDCIVPVNGGGDSYYTLWFVKNILKLNPLAVTYNNLFLSRYGHFNIANLKTKLNVDLDIYQPSLESVRELVRSSMYLFGSIYWHSHAGTTSYPVKVSIRKKIPLIIWGCHEATDQVGMFSHTEEIEMSSRYRHDHHLMSWDIDDLIGASPILNKYNLELYRYPSSDQIQSVGTRGIYLSNYIPWNHRSLHKFAEKKLGLKAPTQLRTFYPYDNPQCAFYDSVHDWIKLFKHGYSRVDDHLARELRWRRIDKKMSDAISKFYRFRKPRKSIQSFCKLMDLEANGFESFLQHIKSVSSYQYYEMRRHSLASSSKTDKHSLTNMSDWLDKQGYPYPSSESILQRHINLPGKTT